MTFPICDGCASSGMLCYDCEEKVRKGDITELDILVSTLLIRQKVEGYEALMDLGNKVVILASEQDAPKVIGPKGRTAESLSKKIGRRVVVLVRGWDIDLVIRSLARPAKLVAKNKVFKEDGSERLKLIFDKPLDEATIKLLGELIGKVEIDYEKKPHVRRTKRKGSR